MKQAIRYLVSLLLYFIGVFLLAKAAFMLYNRASAPYGPADVLQVLLHGLPMDASTAGYLIALPWLAVLIALWVPRLALHRLLRPYFIIVGFALTLVLAADTVLYEFWQYKLDASILNYLNADTGVESCVSWGFLAACALALVAGTLLLCWLPIRLTPRRLPKITARVPKTLAMLLIGGLIFVMVRGGAGTSTMNVGSAYFSDKLFLNHSAVNPLFSLVSTSYKITKFDRQFRLYDDAAACDSVFQGLYPADTEDVADSLLRVSRPQVLLIQLESFGAQFIAELGGHPEVCPEFSRLIKEGVFFDNLYSNSYRTDRGSVCVTSGHVSYPTVSLMKIPGKLNHIPSLAHSLAAEGYTTHFLYGSDINIMGKKGYLVAAGFQDIMSDADFSFKDTRRSKWGANDSLMFHKAIDIIRSRPQGPRWFQVVQTLDSHEPFEVPYKRLDDKVHNAFAWTDHCLGQFIDSLRRMPVWDDLLIVAYADHGMMYEMSYENPEYFHTPLLLLGGALKQPRRIHTLMNQSDIAATLLSQMGISHRQYQWSRNVLSKNYTYPFAYCSYPAGIMFKDSTGASIFDVNASRPVVGQSAPGHDQRLRRAKAILQKSYDLLEKM